MNAREMASEKTWRLRRHRTFLLKARRGALENLNGLCRISLEQIDHELDLLRAELRRRADRARQGGDPDRPDFGFE
jgi:hypothetical protein